MAPRLRLLGLVAALCTVAPGMARAAIPAADAGADQTFAASALPQLVTLSGSGTDPDGGSIVGYEWTAAYLPPGSAASLSSATAASPTFTADVVGTYRFCLEVEDDGGEFSGTNWYALPTAACTHVMVTTAHEALTLPAKGQRNTWEELNDWARALDTLSGAYTAFVAALASVTSSSEGASLVGTDAKANLCSAETVEDALECLDAALTTGGPYLPLAAGSGAVVTGTIYTDSGTTIQATAGVTASETGTNLRLNAGTGTATADATPAGTGGAAVIAAGAGGAGSASAAGGDGGDLSLRGGVGGADGGAGAGDDGSIVIGATNTADVTLGASGVDVNIEGPLDIKGSGWAIAGASVTSSAAELNKLDGAGVTVTAANLDTLTDGSNADALHTHAVPWPATVTTDALTSTTGRARMGNWTLSTAETWTTVRCYGACASTDGDATDCSVELCQHDGTVVVTVTVPDGECGDTTGSLARFDESFAVSGLSPYTSGAVWGARAAGSGTCELAGVICVAVP